MKFKFWILLLIPCCVRADLFSSVTNALGTLEALHFTIDTDRVDRAVIEAIAKATDPAARVLVQGEWDIMEKQVKGIAYHAGICLSKTNGLPHIVVIETESSAARAGLKIGDILEAINDVPVQGLDVLAALRLFRSPSNATLRVRFNGTNEVSFVLEELPLPTVELDEKLGEGIRYVRINGLYEGSSLEVAGLIRTEKNNNSSGVILDLRDAGGGDVQSVDEVASLFTSADTLLYSFHNLQYRTSEDHTSKSEASPAMPVVLLVNGETRGAAELLAAAVSGIAHTAILVGSRTHGDPLLRESITLPSGDLLYVATRKLVTADGTTYDGRAGAEPHVVTKTESDAIEEYEPMVDGTDRRITLDEELADRKLRERLRGDETLQRAVDILLGLKALNIRGIDSAHNPAR